MHLIGVGGINMSAVAKLLLAAGVKVSGSDVRANEQTKILAERGADIKISERAENIPADCELVIITSAAPATNQERLEAGRRALPELTNFAFLGQWFADAKTIVVAGTHGKSTTTALLGLMLERAGLDPTVIVGSKAPGFPDGNFRPGQSDLFVVEGDEYSRHFLEFNAHGLILNNLELDHTDVFANLEAVLQAFHELVNQVKTGGVIVANVADKNVARLLETEADSLQARNIQIIRFGGGAGAWQVTSEQTDHQHEISLVKDAATFRFNLGVPGKFNALNAADAVLMAQALGAAYPDIGATLESFKGIWRRFEFLGEQKGALIYSDYGHHPTAVAATLQAVRESFPDRRVVLCFEPHHRNRTRALFADFVPSFDSAHVLVLSEIYEVAGRDAAADQKISSQDLIRAVTEHDGRRGVSRAIEYAPDPNSAVRRTLELAQPNDVIIFMGAGDIDEAARSLMVSRG